MRNDEYVPDLDIVKGGGRPGSAMWKITARRMYFSVCLLPSEISIFIHHKSFYDLWDIIHKIRLFSRVH